MSTNLLQKEALPLSPLIQSGLICMIFCENSSWGSSKMNQYFTWKDKENTWDFISDITESISELQGK